MTQRLDYSAQSPDGMKAFMSVHNYVGSSSLPKLLIDLVYMRVSQINGCAFCMDQHSRDLLKEGLSKEKLVLLQAWRECGELFNAKERAALAWAETVTRVSETGVPDFEFQSVKEHFSEKELADLTIAVGLMNALNRMAISFRTTPIAARHVKVEA